MTAMDEIENALTLARTRLNEAPGFQLFISIVAQLEYLLSVVNGKEKDRSRVKDIIVGHFAVREFEESDPQFSQALKAAQFIAYNIERRLKV